MIDLIKMLFRIVTYVFKLPFFMIIVIRDLWRFLYNKEYKIFRGYGIHCYVGLFGAGKTLAQTKKAYALARRYPDLNIYSNYKLMDFPNMERVHHLRNFQQIIDAPPGSLFLIDEIGTLFNSRDWQKFPPDFIYFLFQNRKVRKQILATVQVWDKLDKQIRDITFTVRDCKTYLRRWTFIRIYDQVEYSNQTAVMLRAKPIGFDNFISRDFHRNLYDTDEMIDKFRKMEFLTLEEKRTQETNVTSINYVKTK